MKKLFIILPFLLPLGKVTAQGVLYVDNLKIRGDRYYDIEKYSTAAELYQQALINSVNDPSINWRLAESFRKTFNYEDAEVYYRKVYFNHPEAYPSALYYYALMLKYNAFYEESLLKFSEFIQNNKDSSCISLVEQAYVEKAGIEYVLEEENLEGKFTAHHFPPPINSPYHDFAPALLNNDAIVVTSGRINSRRAMLDERYGEAFTNNYYFQKYSNEWVNKTKDEFKSINTPYNDGSGSFNALGNKYYFTTCGGKEPNCLIYLTRLEKGKWTEPQPLNSNINLSGYDTKQPSISNGGDTIFFVSDRPGGKGKNDIWMSINSGNEDWGPAINLGNSVNTKLNEISPKITVLNNTLLFSSEGHQGYGGFDIYVAKRLTAGDTLLYNIGKPFNSSMDDCFADVTDKIIVWSSNRTSGLGNFDLYYEDIDSEISFLSWINLKKGKAKRGEAQLFSRRFETSNTQIYTVTNEDRLSYNHLSYKQKKIVDDLIKNKLDINAIEHVNDFEELPAKEKALLLGIAEQQWREMETIKRPFDDSYKVDVNGINKKTYITGVIKDNLDNVAPDLRVYLEGGTNELIKMTLTDENGTFRFTDLPANIALHIRIDNTSNSGLMVSDLKIQEFSNEHSIKFDNIYFDFDHFTLRPEARKTLDELAAFLKRFKAAQVEIFAHADGHGSEKYNLMLTRKRGEAVVDYLLKKGVRATGLAVRAEGKEAPVAPNNDMIGRQLNRRVEFYINGAEQSYTPSAKTYFIKDNISVEKFADKAGISIAELIKLNGYSQEDMKLKKYQPVRLHAGVAPPDNLVYSF